MSGDVVKDVRTCIDELRPFGTRFYTLLDAARNPRIWPAIRDADERHVCLFAGDLDPAVIEVAPYLVALEPEAPFTSWLLEHGWGDSWGLWCASPADIDELRSHFRRYTMVRGEDQKSLYFRFYDPRVWRDFMELSDDVDRGQLFGPVDCFWCESADSAAVLHYSRDTNGEVHITPHALAAAGGAA